MANPIRKHLFLLLFALPLAAAAQKPSATGGGIKLGAKDAAAARALTIDHWQVDKRGVPSFDYRYSQTGPGCAYERSGHAVAGFEDNGDSVELEVYNPQGADGKEGAPIGTFYDEPNGVVFSMPVQGKGKSFWVSFEDPRMKKTLGAKCGFAGRGDAVVLKSEIAAMPLKIIVLGDATDHGGKVIAGSPVHDIDGKPIARLGDLVDCPVHGENKIVTAHPTLTVGGVAVAVDGCETECGSRLFGRGRAGVEASSG